MPSGDNRQHDEGDHKLEVYAIDSAGNSTSPYVAIEFRIEGYPNTTIDPMMTNKGGVG